MSATVAATPISTAPIGDPAVHIFGIRHHGPGSAQSLRQALIVLKPDIVLVEGPPDANDLLPMAAQGGMKPPVALLLYNPEDAQQSVYYPFAEFSPEWQAIQYALKQSIPVQFMDLPQAHQLLSVESLEAAIASEFEDFDLASLKLEDFLTDPLLELARAAGDTDVERWWERLVEQRHDRQDVFPAILTAMVELRSAFPKFSANEREQQREAYMRQTIRSAKQAGHSKIAVVCGAWHSPALLDLANAKADQTLLKGLPKTKINATWIPWTQGRLAQRTGYGAGIESPGWYEYLWQSTSQRPKRSAHDPKSLLSSRWMVRVARLLRQQGLDASSASVIESVRLAESLAALRHYALPGLAELNEATQTVFCFGDPLPMQLIHEKLIIRDRLGKVPDDMPIVPLQQDLQRWQKRLRLKPTVDRQDLTLDLRQENDRARSQLLHRLNLLEIPWGQSRHTDGKGTFKEGWQLHWEPELEVRLIEMGTWGNTVELASASYLIHLAQTAEALPALTTLLDRALLADLTTTIAPLMQRIQAEAAIAADIFHLMEAVPPLAQVMRYGNVRSFDAAILLPIVAGLITRICISLPVACGSLDEAAATLMDEQLVAVNGAVGLIQIPDLTETWQATLKRLTAQNQLAGLVAGRCCRLLMDAGVMTPDEVAQRFSLALSTANEPTQAAAWVSGLLRGSGLVLLHNTALWRIMDDWVSGLNGDAFQHVLPLLRRTFSEFPAAERRQMGQQVSQGRGGTTIAHTQALAVDPDRANQVLPILQRLLGAN